MCTNETLKKHIKEYAKLKTEIAKLDALAKAESEFIVNEMSDRETDIFDGKKIITERLTENATKAGKQALKELYPENIDTFINVTLSVFVNTANAKKFL